jgi:hypothetical protein
MLACMLREYLVDGDVNPLHVKRSLSMMCSVCYRFCITIAIYQTFRSSNNVILLA